MPLTSGQGKAFRAWSRHRTHAVLRPRHGPHAKRRKARTLIGPAPWPGRACPWACAWACPLVCVRAHGLALGRACVPLGVLAPALVLARACLHALFQLLRRSPDVVSGMVAPFCRQLTKPNGFSGAPFSSLTRLKWETHYPETAILLSALSGVSQQD